MTVHPLAPHYHVGIVVPDIEAARNLLGDQLGVRWGPVLRLDSTEYRDAQGLDFALPATICYSVEGPRIELLEEVPGSLWVRNEHSNLHHIGFWSEDLAADSARLNDSGSPLEVSGRSGERAPVSFTYHRSQLGVRIELVDAAMRDIVADLLFHPDES